MPSQSCDVMDSRSLRLVVVVLVGGALVLAGVGHRVQWTLRPRGATVQLQNLPMSRRVRLAN